MTTKNYLELGDVPDDGAAFDFARDVLTIHTASLTSDVRGLDNVRELRDFLNRILQEHETPTETAKCGCADSLNFGEPQPDCSTCGGTGTVRVRSEPPFTLGERLVIQMTGCIGNVDAEVVDVEGTEHHPGPWLNLVGDKSPEVRLKTDDFFIVERPAIK